MTIHTKLHQSEHQDGGLDEIAQGSLLPQDPTSHASSHETGGSDVLNLDATQIADGSVSNTEYQYLDGVSGSVASQDYVDSKLQGLDWQESVIDKDVADPSTLTPSSGDRYIVASGGTGDWTGDDEKIAEYDGSSWDFTTPDEGFAVWVEDENVQYTYNGTYDTGSWVSFGSTQDHGALTGLGDDDHTQYLLVDGTRAMGGALDMGTYNITNVGNVDGIDVSAHDHDGDAPNVPNTGLVNSSVTVAGNSVSLGSSTTVAHGDLSSAPTDAHHAGFVGLLDNAGTTVNPDGSDLIQFTDDSIVNADAGTNAIALSITEGNISHDNISGVSSADHHAKYTDEEAQDAVGTIMSGSGATSVNYNDSANTITISSTDNDTHTDVSEGGTSVLSDVSDINFTQSGATTVNVTDDGDGSVSVDISSTDDNTTYSAGSGLSLSSTTFSLDESYSPTWTGTHDFTSGSVLISHYSQSGEPTLSTNELAVWTDTDNSQTYIGYNDGSDMEWVEMTGV